MRDIPLLAVACVLVAVGFILVVALGDRLNHRIDYLESRIELLERED